MSCRLASHGIVGSVGERVAINGTESKWVGVISQLFWLYINDIVYAVDIMIDKFADDRQLYEKGWAKARRTREKAVKIDCLEAESSLKKKFDSG